MTNRTLTNAQASTTSPVNLSPGRLTRRQKAEDSTVFGYECPPDIPALHRDVLRWVQSLDLCLALKNCRRDLANGFLIAEIFSRYFAGDIQMHSFANATSSHFKRDNWAQLQRFCAKQGMDLPVDLVEGTIQGTHGAAVAMLEHLYEVFTGKKVPRLKVPDVSAAAAMEAAARAGGGAGGQADGAKPIAGVAKANANLEFGQASTFAAGDAVSLRKRMASGK